MTATAAPEVTEVELVIGGMTCAACAARVQAKLNKVDGVTATVNLATERAHVTVPAHVSASDLVAVVEATGYSAGLVQPPSADAEVTADEAVADAGMVRRLRRRLILALVFFVPLTDLSIVLSVFPWARFPGWQWFLVVLAAPVATWAAWPFHQAALRQVRHFSSSMDTLVSLGIVAACGWSVYAMFVLDRSRTGLGGLQALLHASGGGDLSGGSRLGDHVPAGRAAVRGPRQAHRRPGDAGAGCGRGQGRVRARRRRRRAAHLGRSVAGGPAFRGAPGGADRRRWRGHLRPVRRGPVHDDGGVGPGRRGRGRQRDRRHHRPDRPPGSPRGQGRPGHSAGAPDRDGRAGSGRKGEHPAPGRPDLCGVRPLRPGFRGVHAGRVAAGREPGRSRFQRRPGRADHRLSLRAGAGYPSRPGSGVRPRRPARHLHQGLPGPGVLPRHRHRGPGQDRDGHHRADDRDRRPARPWDQPHRPAPRRRLGRAGLRARRSRRRDRSGRDRSGAADVR